MALYTYSDAYLAPFCDADRETRAQTEVTRLAAAAAVTLGDDWNEQLVIQQTYVLAALENQADPDDLFASKFKHYRQRFDAMLPQAVAAARQTAGAVDGVGFFSIPLERA